MLLTPHLALAMLLHAAVAGAPPSPRAARLIHTLERSGSVKVRVRAARALGALADPGSTDALSRMVLRAPAAVSAASLGALVRMDTDHALEAAVQCVSVADSGCPAKTRSAARRIAKILWTRALRRHPPFPNARLHVTLDLRPAPKVRKGNRWVRHLMSGVMEDLVGDERIELGEQVALGEDDEEAPSIMPGIRLVLTGTLVEVRRSNLEDGRFEIQVRARGMKLRVAGLDTGGLDIDGMTATAVSEDDMSLPGRVTKVALKELATQIGREVRAWARGRVAAAPKPEGSQ